MNNILNNERGISLVEVVASLLIVSILLISFFGIFIQSKKTGKASEEIVDATYIAQQEMEELYGFFSNDAFDKDDWIDWFDTATTIPLPNSGKTFTYDATDTACKADMGCKKFLFTLEHTHWIQLQKRTDGLVDVILNVPKESSTSSVKMDSIFRWGNS